MAVSKENKVVHGSDLTLVADWAESKFALKSALSGYLPLTGGNMDANATVKFGAGNSSLSLGWNGVTVGGAHLRLNELQIEDDVDNRTGGLRVDDENMHGFYESYDYTFPKATGTLALTSDINTAISGKQDTLVSGTNIKTINNQSLLGSGNITINADTSACELLANKVTSLSSSSTDTQYPSAKATYDALKNKVGSSTVTSIVELTKEEYDNIAVKDPSVLYIVYYEQEDLPDGYTRLVALKRTNSSGYFDTGVVADSSTGISVTFGNNDSLVGNNQPVFGIRRLSGSSDSSKICVYAKADSYFGGFAVVYGTTDTGNITGSGGASMFGGNKMKISVKNKKWYSWDRCIYDGTSESFLNGDSVTFFLGNLAKSANTIYSQGLVDWMFFEASFEDQNGNVTHKFIPCKNNSNILGFYDLVTEEFKEVNNQSHWSAVSTYSHRSYRVNSRFSAIQSNLNCQSCVEKKGWHILVSDSQRYFVLTNDKYEIHSGSSFSQSGRVLECSTYNGNWHGNTCWWSDTYYEQNDYFPLLYVGSDKNNHCLMVYRLAGSDPTTCTISLIQKIYTPIGDSLYGETLYYHNYYGKAGCNTFVQTAYTKNSYNSDSGDYSGNVLMYRVFSLPSVSSGSEVTLAESDIIKRGDVGFQSTTSNGGWNGKYLYITFRDILKVYELTSNGSSVVKSVDFSTHSSSNLDFLITTTYECEGLAWCEERGYFVAMFEPTGGNTFDVYAEDLEQYVRNVYNG